MPGPAENDVVLEVAHADRFQPWPADRLRDCVMRLRQLARDVGHAEATRVALRDAELASFARTYKRIFASVTDPATTPEFLDVVLAMNEAHADPVGTADERATKAHAIALRYCMSQQ